MVCFELFLEFRPRFELDIRVQEARVSVAPKKVSAEGQLRKMNHIVVAGDVKDVGVAGSVLREPIKSD